MGSIHKEASTNTNNNTKTADRWDKSEAYRLAFYMVVLFDFGTICPEVRRENTYLPFDFSELAFT